MKKKAKMIALSTLAMLGLTVNSETLWAQGYFSTIAQSGQAIPVGTGTFSTFQAPLLNNSGQTAFLSNLTGTSGGTADNQGIFLGSSGALTQIVRKGEFANSNGTYSSFSNILLNNVGQVAFNADLLGTIPGSANQGIFRGSGGTPTQIVRLGQSVGVANIMSLGPGAAFNDSGQVAFSANAASGSFFGSFVYRGSDAALTNIFATSNTIASFGNVVLNNSGQAAFFQSGSTGSAIIVGSGGALTQIAMNAQGAPGGGIFSTFSSNVSLNNSGQVAFRADLIVPNGQGIFRGSGGAVSEIARRGQIAPNNGLFDVFSDPVLNDSGQTAFRATLTGTLDDAGIFIGNGGAITQIARKGQAAPGGSGTLTSISTNPFALNNSGQAAFSAEIGSNEAILTGDGIDLIQVVREGLFVGGSTITGLAFDAGGLNESGQIAYRANLSSGNQIVRVWTPDLHWRNASSNTWNTPGQWTLGLSPASVHDVFIDPAANVTVTGPATNTTVRSLQIGGGAGMATLNLNSNLTLTATNGISIESNGTLRARGTVAANIDNAGIIEVGSGETANFNGSLNQNGTLQVFSTGQAIIQGAFSGNGGFAGGGTVVARTELRPGNSPASVLYDGNLVLTGSTDTFIELGGLGLGQFDQLRVTGDLSLAGDLVVSLFDNHTLGAGQQYLIGDVDGVLSGQFNGLGEGALVGVFSGHQTFISYAAGDGNDIALITAIPEPSAAIVLALVGTLVVSRRRREG